MRHIKRPRLSSSSSSLVGRSKPPNPSEATAHAPMGLRLAFDKPLRCCYSCANAYVR